MSQIADLKALLSSTEMHKLPVADQRTGYDALASMMPADESVKISAVDANGLSCEWFSNTKSRDDAVLLYLHGGGYVIGSLISHQPLYADLCKACGIKVLAVDYRLAPEHPFPAAIEDALCAYQYLLDEGYQPDKIAIAGDSAGGGLCLALLISIRDRQLPVPSCAALLSPWTDLSLSGDSINTNQALDPVVAKQGLEDMATHYCQTRSRVDPLVSPLFADLHALPPILIHVGSDEILLDDSRRLEQNLKSAGVNVTLKEWAEMVHVFQHFATILDTGKEALTDIGDYISKALQS